MLHSTNATAVALRLRLFPLNPICPTRNTFSVLLDASGHVRRRTTFLSAPWMTKPMWKHRAVHSSSPAMSLHSSPPSANTVKTKKGPSLKSTQPSRTQSQQEEKDTEDSENLDSESEEFVEQELADHVWLKGEKEQIEQEMQHWVKKAVIGLQLCPFAKLNETRIKVWRAWVWSRESEQEIGRATAFWQILQNTRRGGMVSQPLALWHFVS